MFKKFFKQKEEIKKLKEEVEKLKNTITQRKNTIIGSYLDGTERAWIIVQVCLYDMYVNMEFLDFDSLINGITKRLDEYEKNPKIRENKIEQFNQGMRKVNGNINNV